MTALLIDASRFQVRSAKGIEPSDGPLKGLAGRGCTRVAPFAPVRSQR